MARTSSRALEERLELLMFGLGGTQRFGINVLKVKEVVTCPPLTQLPESHSTVLGVAHFRGESLTIIDMARAIGKRSMIGDEMKVSEGSVIVTEFNRTSVGFWVSDIDRIIVLDWAEIQRPPKGSSSHAYISGVAKIDGLLVQVLDVEKILSETVTPRFNHETSVSDSDIPEVMRGSQVLVVDDSSIARKHVAEVLEKLGLTAITTRDGKEALELLNQWAEEGIDVSSQIPVVVSDIEMPEMDGYTLTNTLRESARYKNMHVILHTSLSGAINPDFASEVGANTALSKFDADDLARAIVEGLKARA
ncbi:MAG: chemotaxis protein CheV [Gammaproteobacteria bacterium]|nr:chemotaxis protein CheV [Gammaproteobacteria bacterium]